MPTRETFGDVDSEDSSDEDVGETPSKQPTPSKDVEMKDAPADPPSGNNETPAKKGEGSSDDDSDEEMKDETPAEKKKETMDDDSDDDDAELSDSDDDLAAAEKEETQPSKDGNEDKSEGGSEGKYDKKNEAGLEGSSQEKEKEKDKESTSKEIKKKDNTELFGDDDSESSDEEIGGGASSPKKSSAPKESSGGDDLLEDSDEDDVEFDDDGAVTGTGHSKGFQRKKSQQPKSTLDKIREAEAAEADAMEMDAEEQQASKPKPPAVDPRTMVVLEPDLPPTSASLHVTKLPNLVGIQPEAFDPKTYSAQAEEQEFGGYVHDMMRWRYKTDKDGNFVRDDDGKLQRESNSRLIQWEDGSYTLHVGKEAFEVDNIDSSRQINTDGLGLRTATFAGLNGYLYLSQIATLREPKANTDEIKDTNDQRDGETKEEGKREETEETPAGTVLECMGAVGSRMTARPASLRSEAHKSLTVAVRQKTIKKARISEIVTHEDPEAAKQARIKVKEGLEKEAARKRNYTNEYRSRSRPRVGMNRRYLEEDDGDFDTVDIRAMKRRTMNADDEDMDDYGDDFDDYGDDDDEEEEATFNRKRPKKKQLSKALEDDSDDDEDDVVASKKAGEEKDDDDDDDDDDDEEIVAPVKSHKKRPHQAVFDDDDSD